jgi:hypothetical protein
MTKWKEGRKERRKGVKEEKGKEEKRKGGKEGERNYIHEILKIKY